jgi:hypothetical protein
MVIDMGYDPAIGRFLEMDPDTDIDGPNEYQLEESNPVDSLDPTGTRDWFGKLAHFFDWWGQGDPKGAGENCMQYATGLVNWNLADALKDGVLTPAQAKAFRDSTGDAEMNAYWNDPKLFNKVLTSDFQHEGKLPPPSEAQKPDPTKYHKVRAYIYKTPIDGLDYHFIQQHSDGSWSGKHGLADRIDWVSLADQDCNKTFVGEWWILGPTVSNPQPAPPPQGGGSSGGSAWSTDAQGNVHTNYDQLIQDKKDGKLWPEPPKIPTNSPGWGY